MGHRRRVGAGSSTRVSVVRAPAGGVPARRVRVGCPPAVVAAWAMRNLAAGRAVYATGSNDDAARLAGINMARVKCAVFAWRARSPDSRHC